jgi:hypothetical protein
MPERRYRRGDGTSCLKCWINNLRHGCPEAQNYLRKHPELIWDTTGDRSKLEKESQVWRRRKSKRAYDEHQQKKKELDIINEKISEISQIIEVTPSLKLHNRLDKLFKQRTQYEIDLESKKKKITTFYYKGKKYEYED